MPANIYLTGILIFIARICDVSLGTLRTIATVNGRTRVAFILGFIELNIWVTVIAAVIKNINASYILGFFYALGFATGNATGILIEKKLAMGSVVLRVFTETSGTKIADRIRKHGQAVTIFMGKGMKGDITMLYVACDRRDLKWILKTVKEEDPQAFYVMEHAREVSKTIEPTYYAPGGWRSILKKI